MELPTKMLEKISFITDPKTEEHLCEPLQTNFKHFKIVAFFFSGCNLIFNVTNKNNNIIFISKFGGAQYNNFNLPKEVYEIEGLDKEFKRLYF